MVSVLFPSSVTRYSIVGNRERYIYALPSKSMVLKLTEGQYVGTFQVVADQKAKRGD